MANEDTAKISEEVTGLKADIARIAESVSEFIRTRGQDAASRIQGTAEETWNETKQKLGCVKQKIQDEPVAATAVAFGVGLVVGLLLSGRRRR
ncbi:MAG: hypothetical protein WCD42_09890 [Rhizomicrobium sp.]